MIANGARPASSPMAYGVGPVSSTTSPVSSVNVSPARSQTDEPRAIATAVSAASSCTRIAHGSRHRDPEHERVAGAGRVQQRGQRVHAGQARRIRM